MEEAYEMHTISLKFEGMDAERKAQVISVCEYKASCSLNLELFRKFIDTSNDIIMQYIVISNLLCFLFQFTSITCMGGITQDVSRIFHI